MSAQNAVYGNQERIIRVMLELGIEENEVFYGLQSLSELGHNLANYGLYKRFIFSKTI